jgi:hypothetical protein
MIELGFSLLGFVVGGLLFYFWGVIDTNKKLLPIIDALGATQKEDEQK